MKRNWIRKIIGALSFTSVLFVFQACYGTPQDFKADFLIEGQVKSKTTGLPIKGIKVSIAENNRYQMTDETGHFSIYTETMNTLKIQFDDIDSTLNGLFNRQDTVLRSFSEKVYLDIHLVEK